MLASLAQRKGLVSQTKEEYNAYMAEYMKERYYKRRAFWLAELGAQCVDCKTTENLEFDHDDPSTKSFDVAKALAGWAEARLTKEMAKCVLRCYGCHKAKSAAEQSVEHGQGLTGKKSCRCELCAPLKNEYSRALRYGPERKINKERVCGTYSTYKAGCRCVECKKANADYMRQLKKRKLARDDTDKK